MKGRRLRTTTTDARPVTRREGPRTNCPTPPLEPLVGVLKPRGRPCRMCAHIESRRDTRNAIQIEDASIPQAKGPLSRVLNVIAFPP